MWRIRLMEVARQNCGAFPPSYAKLELTCSMSNPDWEIWMGGDLKVGKTLRKREAGREPHSWVEPGKRPKAGKGGSFGPPPPPTPPSTTQVWVRKNRKWTPKKSNWKYTRKLVQIYSGCTLERRERGYGNWHLLELRHLLFLQLHAFWPQRPQAKQVRKNKKRDVSREQLRGGRGYADNAVCWNHIKCWQYTQVA